MPGRRTRYQSIPLDDEVEDNPSPETEASWVSKLLFCWVVPVIQKVIKRKTFTVNNLHPTKPEDKSVLLYSKFKRIWDSGGGSKKPSLIRCSFALIWKELIFYTIGSILNGLIPIAQTVLVGSIVDYLVGTPGVLRVDAWLCGAGIALLAFTSTVLNNQVIYLSFRFGLIFRVIFSSALYNKILEMDIIRLGHIGTGKILTLFSTDIETIVEALKYLSFALAFPVAFPLGAFFLYVEGGWASLSGLLLSVLVTAIFTVLQPMISHLRHKAAEATGRRMQLMNEVIQAIAVVKMYTWERPFGELVSKRRREELQWIIKSLSLRMMQLIYHYALLSLAQFVSVVTITQTGQVLTQGLLVRTVGYLNACSYQAIYFGFVLFNWAEALRSFYRIQDFLHDTSLRRETIRENTSYAASGRDLENSLSKDLVVNLENIWSNWGDTTMEEGKKEDNTSIKSWNIQATGFEMQAIDIEVKKGELLVVCGPVGAGKTSLFMTLMGHMHITSGRHYVTDSVAYVPQEAWVFAGTVQNNVLLGERMNAVWYTEVIGACGLLKDLESFPDGDQTLVGERGMALSGGQKARINLARAVYQNKDLYLLDDPLSAVDVHIGHQLFHRCICDCLGKKARILVTHQLEYLEQADKIIVIEKGVVIAAGNYKEVLPFLPREQNGLQKNGSSAQSQLEQKTAAPKSKAQVSNELINDNIPGEQSESGIISWNTYRRFAGTGHGCVTLLPSVILCLAFQASASFGDWWVSDWAKEVEELYESNLTNQSGEYESINHHREVVYMWDIIAMILLSLVSSALLLTFAYLVSSNMHNRMFKYVLGATMTFFHRTPVGIILNRFSRDLGLVDALSFSQMSMSITWSIKFIGFIALSCIAVPWVAIAIIPCSVVVLVVREYGMKGGRDFKRVEAVCRSPIFSHVSNTLEGHVSIQAFQKVEQFCSTMYGHQDQHTSAYHLFIHFRRWMSVAINFTTAAYMAALIIVTFVMDTYGSVNGGLLGIVIVQNIGMVENLARALNQSTDFESTMTSVERILSYTNLPQEENASGSIEPAFQWPNEGRIQFENMKLKYENTNVYVLRNLSFVINAREKIGIIGRTGAGKSSIFRAMMRLVDHEGHIYIDDFDINLLQLDVLRKSLSVIPQDPVLFSGTLRKNLDPFDEFTDDDIWHALEQVQMDSYVRSIHLQLQSEAGEYGGYLSVGQKQLMCLARALLRRNKILIVDEATANVDRRTDELIQQTVRESFVDCTVLTIAHRLNTVMDSDRIMVLGDGQLLEFDAPHVLLEDASSELYNLYHYGQTQAA